MSIKIFSFLTILFISASIFSQSSSSTFSISDLEVSFLTKNYQLLAEKYNINKADAEVIQAKLWHNPNLSLNNVNLWSNNTAQKGPYLFNQFGDKQEFAFDLQQVIETANKRRKRIALKTTEKNIATLDFESLVNTLKFNLRTDYYQLQQIDKVKPTLTLLSDYYSQLIDKLKFQVEQQNVSKAEYYRIQTGLITIKKQLTDLEIKEIDLLQELSILTQIPNLQLSQLKFDSKINATLYNKVISNLTSGIVDSSIAQRYVRENINRSEQLLKLEKANAKPDLTLMMNYDRMSSTMINFVGFGIGIDIPLFNRNQGNIKIAQFEIEQQKLNSQSNEITLKSTIEKYQLQLQKYENLLNDIAPTSFDEYKNMMQNYLIHYQEKQISLIELIDFSDSFLQAQEQYYQLYNDYLTVFEQLQYLIGKDL